MTERLPAGPDERAGRAQAARTLGLVPSLDGLRGVAVVLICALHLSVFIPTWTKVAPGLFVGVNIFFVLSGFLITAILLREHDRTGRIRLTPFYEGRVLRLFPALFAMVAVEFVWSMFLRYPLAYELKSVASGLTYVSNWGFSPWRVTLAQAAGHDVAMGHLWSLAVEEQFYLFWPLILIGLLVIARRFSIAPIVVVVAAIVAVGVHRIDSYLAIPATTFRNGFGWSRLYERTDFRVDDLLWGVLLGLLWVRGWFPRKRLAIAGWLGVAVVVATVFVGSTTSGWVYVWGMPVIAIGTAAVVLACVEIDWPLKRAMETRWLCAVGVVSYGVYLWHMLAYAMVTRAGPHWPAGLQVAAALSLTAVMAVGSWFLVEKPFLRVKDRLRRRASMPESTRDVAPARAGEPLPQVDPEVAGLFDPSPSTD